jgi:cytochrome c biogenesis protein CcmG, thiol:disulfide interchange protein DsbE
VTELAGKRRSFLTLLPLLAFAALAALFLVGLMQPDKSRLPSTLIGLPAPDVVFPGLEGLAREGGGQISGFGANDLRKGDVTLVNVFASWCAPCHAEHPFLMELSKQANLRLAGINQKDVPENARRFLAAKGNPYGFVGVDPNGRGSIEWGVYGIPETFVVRPDGVIAHRLVGPITASNLESLKSEIEKARKGNR